MSSRIMRYQLDSTFRKSGKGNLFIGGLDKSVDNKAMHPPVYLSCDILFLTLCLRNFTKPSRSSVAFFLANSGKPKKEVPWAMDSSNMTTPSLPRLLSRPLPPECCMTSVFTSNPTRSAHLVTLGSDSLTWSLDQARTARIRNFTNVYVRNLDPGVTKQEFEGIFAEFGEISSSFLRSGRGGNFGFIYFKTHAAAAKAVKVLHDSQYKGKTLHVARAQSKAEREEELRRLHGPRSVGLSVTNLDSDVDDEKLRSEFESSGNVVSTKILRDSEGHSMGSGYVYYSSPEDASNAMEKVKNKTIGSKPIHVSFAKYLEIPRGAISQRNAPAENVTIIDL
jgi:polyadenylate-binding protein